MGASHIWWREGCRRLMWLSQSESGTAGAVGVQEALEVNGHLDLSPWQVCFSVR